MSEMAGTIALLVRWLQVRRPGRHFCGWTGYRMMIFDAATGDSPETRELLRAKLAGRNEVMDAMIASLDGHLRRPAA